MLQGQALSAKSVFKEVPIYDTVKDEYGQEQQVEKGAIRKEETLFSLVDLRMLVDGAISDGMLQKIPQEKLNHYVRMFEAEAKKTLNQKQEVQHAEKKKGDGGRDQFRKAPPKKPIKERVQEARDMEKFIKKQTTQAIVNHKKLRVDQANAYQKSQTSVN